MASAARAGLCTLHPPRRLGVQVHAGRARSRVKPEAARGAQPQASTERVRISGQRPALDRRSPAGGHHDDGIRRRGGWRVRPARSGFSPPPPAHHGADPRPLGFACESQDVRPPNQASAARSAGTARRRQGLKPEGARRRGRLDAKHESPPPQGRRTDDCKAFGKRQDFHCAVNRPAFGRYLLGQPSRTRHTAGNEPCRGGAAVPA